MNINKITAVVYLLFIASIVLHIWRTQKDERQKWLWLLVVLFVPVIGGLAYVIYMRKVFFRQLFAPSGRCGLCEPPGGVTLRRPALRRNMLDKLREPPVATPCANPLIIGKIFIFERQKNILAGRKTNYTQQNKGNKTTKRVVKWEIQVTM